MTWPDGYLEANGIRMHYWRTGDGSKPAVVLAHGFSDNGLCWTPVAQALERDYDVIMVDARGHGLTDAPETGYTTPDRAADLAEFVRALGLQKPAVLGHSMGASTAAAAAASYPDCFGKVLLEDPAWWEGEHAHQTMTDEEHERVLKERQEKIVKQKRMSRKALIKLCREQSPIWQEAELEPWALSKQQLSPKVVTGFESKPRPWREIAALIRVPTLLITADIEKGAIVTPEIAEAAPNLNDKIEAVNIAGAGHNIRREAFDAYMDAIKDFLAR